MQEKTLRKTKLRKLSIWGKKRIQSNKEFGNMEIISWFQQEQLQGIVGMKAQVEYTEERMWYEEWQ